jgi:hypothetical protein
VVTGNRVDSFERHVLQLAHRAVLRDVRAAIIRQRTPWTAVCTIYNGNLPEDQARSARIALMMFNDVILRTAFEWRLPVIELRSICSEPPDYANPIEPSGTGGEKIARAIVEVIRLAKEPRPISCVFAG